jgi:spore maturation protein CgeB
VVAQNPQNFVDLCRHYSQNEGERIEMARKQKAEVLASHTYHHRMQTLFAALGMDGEAKGMVG